MIKFPAVGMRVKNIDPKSDKYGCVGEITHVGYHDGYPTVTFDHDGAVRVIRPEGLRMVGRLGRGA